MPYYVSRDKETNLRNDVKEILPSGEHVLENGENEFEFELFIPIDLQGSFHYCEGGYIRGGRKATTGWKRWKDASLFSFMKAP